MSEKMRLKAILPAFLIIVLASILRLIWLDKIPNAIGGDELDYILTAKAIFLTGKDVSGKLSPVSLFRFKYPAGEFPKAELPYLLFAPFVGLLDFSLLTVRLPYVFFSILIPFLIYLIAKKLLGKDIGIIAGFVAAINPWLIYIGRTSYESSPAVFFYLCGLYVLLIARGWKIMFALPFLFLGFYSYIATKLIFLPFVFIIAFYAYWYTNKRRFLPQYLLLCFFSILLVAFFVFSLKQVPGDSRLGEILLPNAPEIAQQVDDLRRISIKTPLTNLLVNKITVFLRIVITKFFKIFSLEYLFLYGDSFFSIWWHGLFYYLDAIFLFLGFMALFIRHKKLFLFFLLLVILGTFPQVFHRVTPENMAIHISLTFPFLIIFIAVGIWHFLQLVKNKYFFYTAASLIIVLYVILVLNFFNIYIFQHSLQGYFDFHVRILSKYISLAQGNEQSIIISTTRSPDLFKKYLFYTNSYNRNTTTQIRQIFEEEKIELGKVKFTSCNPDINLEQKTDLVIYDVECGITPKDLKYLRISRLSDGGETYRIYNDHICSDFDLNRYPANISLSDFAVEKLSRERFCQKFISDI